MIQKEQTGEMGLKPSKVSRRRVLWIALLLAAVTFLIYLPSLFNDFVDWDDPLVVTDNLNIRSFSMDSLAWMATTFHMGNWIPLTWLSHAVDYSLFGLNPTGHHLTSVLIHCLNTALVFFLFLKILR